MQCLFIHGLGQNSSSWNKTTSLVSTADDITCPDLWTMMNRKEMTYENIYQSFINYCENISEPINLCGLSLGGIIALNYAIDYPNKVHSIVLIGAQYKTPKGLMKFQNLIFRLMPNNSFAEMGMKKTIFLS